MLVLSRHKEESIVIGDDNVITITVIEIRGDKVRLGIEAPKNIAVHRLEIIEAIRSSQATPVVCRDAVIASQKRAAE